MTALTSLLALLTPREKRRGALVLAAAVLMALVDTAGVASIMPFLAVLGNPGLIETNDWLAELYRLGGFASPEGFLFALGLGALATVLCAAIIRAAGQYAIFRFANMRRYSLSRRLVDGYLGSPFDTFLGRNSADLTKRALSDVDTVVDNCLIPVLQMIAYGLIAVLLVILLVAADPVLAALVLAVVGGFYTAIFLLSRRLLSRLGLERSEANRARFTVAGEAFGGIKELKLFGREHHFSQRFAGPASAFARHKAAADAVALLPRYLIEAIGFGGVLALALFLLAARGDVGGILPILGLYAFAGYRLLPATQTVYNGLVRLRFHLPMVDAILADLPPADAAKLPRQAPAPLAFEHAVRFESVSYGYPGAAKPTLANLDLEIGARTTIGIIGPTGAGKTTLVDLLLGLLQPTEGRILIDGVPLAPGNLRAWQRNIGYVPQSIFLADASLMENIAFGIPPGSIDAAAAERAARIANIHDFVVAELPDGYATVIGERGVRLSGGQRQRIGIARALYHDPALLVFDEATSALDTATESAVMEATGALRGAKTMVIVAHRIATLRPCDKIAYFKAGALVAQGTWESLSARNAAFRRMARAAASTSSEPSL